MLKNIIYIGILILIITSLCTLPIISVPISSSSRGTIRSIQENTQISAVVSGKIIQSRLGKNNQEIKQGDTLLVVTAEQLDTQKNLQNNQSQDYNAQLSDLQKISLGNFIGLQTGQYQKEVSAMQEKMAQVQTQLSLAQKDYDRAASLYNQGVIPKAEYDKYYYDYQGLKKQISGVREQQIAQWQAQKRETERQLRSLGSEVQRISQEQKNYIITAPVSGRLVNFSGIQKGNFLVQGQNIGEISPDQSLVAECLVSPKDIGFIHTGQDVKFQIDTYNYNQWGLLKGKVQEIDKNIKVNQQTGEAFFRVLCKMDNNYLQLKNGYKGDIGKGMSFTARFHLIDRTLWQLLFDRVDDWFNPKLK
ncbi:HlyD family efflux transporter periplasmic adaptor subunit [Chryseobacterium sp. RP-3-3]|uniref:HlyD family efflux transporter periplasmic adaptor subunit n=1 Tax=Chryseobacterium antibioticum TaxID=2728847 RepID=A0A7Y0FPU6_9FLAO|nr:HlyD family efflux transporter periplasmic adaptor subunit [Chryseobacterium antibioticum]NML68338.1 HlyD family efflux transporter periplasmic adaptor subunit [Chryseobacterium antibioticum]